MAWSGNIVAFGKSPLGVARILSQIAEILHLRHLTIKPSSAEIVPANTGRKVWPSISLGGLTFEVVDEMKTLGYWITCNGDPVRTRSSVMGTLRGKLASMDKRFVCVPQARKAKWWQLQFRGVVGYFAAFIGCCCTWFRKLTTIANAGARKVLGVTATYNVASELKRVQDAFKISVHEYFCKSVVTYVGHCFRHVDSPVYKLLSLPLDRRLTDLRRQGQRTVPSGFAQASFNYLSELGFELGQLVAGRPQIRGQAGYAFRWGDGWFSAVRDGGCGWSFERNDKSAVQFRVQLLVKIFQRDRSNLPRMIGDGPLELEDSDLPLALLE